MIIAERKRGEMGLREREMDESFFGKGFEELSVCGFFHY
jgi:hypothetical protein